MRAEAQEAARQRLQIQLQQQQQLHHQLQPRRIQPVQAQGVLAEMAEFMRVAEEGGLSDEVRSRVSADRWWNFVSILFSSKSRLNYRSVAWV